MNLQDILDQVNYRLNKDQSGNTMSPLEYNNILKVVNQLFFNWKYGLPQEYQPGMPISRQAWEVSTQITDDLGHLLVLLDGVENPLMLLDADGVATLPDDYMHVSSVYFFWFKNKLGCVDNRIKKTRPVIPVFDAELGPTLGNANRKPTLRNPIYRLANGKVRVFPETIDRVAFSYLRKPTTPVYAYTLVNDEPVYNPAASTELDWPDQTHPDIINLIVDIASDNLKDSFEKQFSNMRKKEGV